MVMPSPRQKAQSLLLEPVEHVGARDGGAQVLASGSKKSKAKRSQLIPVACTPCQKRKSKCSGDRPTCVACQKRGQAGVAQCSYMVENDKRRTTAFQEKIKLLEEVIRGVVRDPVKGMPIAKALVDGNFQQLPSAAAEIRNCEKPEEDQLAAMLEDASVMDLAEGSGVNQFQAERYVFKPASAVHGYQPVDAHVYSGHPAGMRSPKPDAVELCGAQPRNISDGSRMDEAFASFIDFKRSLLEQGYDESMVLGPLLPGPVGSRLAKDLELAPTSTTSEWVMAWIQTWSRTGIMGAAELALGVSISYYLNWRILPTHGNFRKMPAFMHPTFQQLSVPHRIWLDFIPWPEVRDRLLEDPSLALPDDVFATVVGNLSVNWPLGVADAIEPQTMKFQALFLSHILDLDNWSVPASVLSDYPALVGKARLRESHGGKDVEKPTNIPF